MLNEIIARVPFEDPNWSQLQLVNRHINEIMATKSLKIKAARIQFNLLYRLLPESLIENNPVKTCKYWLSRCSPLMQRPPEINDLLEEIVDLGVMFSEGVFIYLIHPTGNGIAVKHEENDDTVRCCNFWEMRHQLLYFRLLRLMPPEINPLLRYCALRLYECLYTGAAATFRKVQPPAAAEADDRMLADVHLFLEFEDRLAEMPEFVRGAYNPSYHEVKKEYWADKLKQSSTSVPLDQAVLIKRTGKYLPSAIAIQSAAHYLHKTPYTFAILKPQAGLQRIVPMEWCGNSAKIEAMQQMKTIQQVCERIEAEDGDYANQILCSLRPEVIRPIMTQQAHIILKMSL